MTVSPTVSATISPTRLPRAASLTEALTSSAGTPPPASFATALARQLATELGALWTRSSGGERLRVDEYLLATTGAAGGGLDDEPFRWSAVTARRTLGIAAVRACHHGLHRTPAEAVAGVLERLVEDACGGRGRGGSLGRWLAGLPAGARAAVQADAVTWATRLHVALHWPSLPAGTVVGGRDEWWDCPADRRIALRGRAEVRTWAPAPDAEGSHSIRRPALLCLRPGTPGPTSRTELALPALVSVLVAPGEPAPARVVGWWPSCGRAVVLSLDEPVLEQAAEAVVTAASRRVAGARPGGAGR